MIKTFRSFLGCAALALASMQIQAMVSAQGAETAIVSAVATSIPQAVDLLRYDLGEAAFAPRVTVDFTSVWGGKPSVMTPEELMAAWRGFLPGFDATWHELTHVRARVDGDRATASAVSDARHWIDGRAWRLQGEFRWALEKQGGSWKVTAMRFVLRRESGGRPLALRAMERAKTQPAKSPR